MNFYNFKSLFALFAFIRIFYKFMHIIKTLFFRKKITFYMLFMLRNCKHSINELPFRSIHFFSSRFNIFEDCLLVANNDTRCFSVWLFPYLMQFFSYNLPHKLVEIEYIPATVSTRLERSLILRFLLMLIPTPRLQNLTVMLWMTRFRLCWSYGQKLVTLCLYAFYALCYAIIS